MRQKNMQQVMQQADEKQKAALALVEQQVEQIKSTAAEKAQEAVDAVISCLM